jgi:ribosomal protein L3 glutamine methyltransferase
MSRRKADSLARAADELSTLGEWLEFAVRLYAREKVALGQTAPDAHDEALYLMLHALGWPLDSDRRALAKRLTPAENEALREMLGRRVYGRTPAAYLTHEAWLGGQHFYVDERVIIPRSYFVEIIPNQLNGWLRQPGKVRHVVDVCTGSGCLAILLAQHFPKAKVDAIDLSADALEVAKLNLAAHRLERRVTLHRSDVFKSVPHAEYDVILSNPPYEPSTWVDAQEPEFRAEPRLAHDGGKDGLDIIRELLRQSRSRLAPDGIVLIEVGGLRPAIDREFAELEPHWLHTDDGADCVCVIHAARLRRSAGARRAKRG